MSTFFGKIAAGMVKGYQDYISPLTPPSCRFFPVCSEYSKIAFLRHGFIRGFWLTVIRIIRCNPFNDGGWDPVPPRKGEPDDTPSDYMKLEDDKKYCAEMAPGKSDVE